MIYLDSNVIIRFLEGTPAARDPIQLRLATETVWLTSQLSRLECRCRPIRDNDTTLLHAYDAFFASAEVRVIDIDIPVVDLATTIRAVHNLKAPDAIHLASAEIVGASAFLTGDLRLTRYPAVNVELI